MCLIVQGGKGYVRNIVYRDINLIDVRRPIIIDQNYVDQMRPLSNEVRIILNPNVLSIL